MKKVNRLFAMGMLEKTSGKTRDQILEEAQFGSGDFPMGVPELENRLLMWEKFAEATLRHFGSKRPQFIKREDIDAIDMHVSGERRSAVREFELNDHRTRINIVFDIFEDG